MRPTEIFTRLNRISLQLQRAGFCVSIATHERNNEILCVKVFDGNKKDSPVVIDKDLDFGNNERMALDQTVDAIFEAGIAVEAKRRNNQGQ